MVGKQARVGGERGAAEDHVLRHGVREAADRRGGRPHAGHAGFLRGRADPVISGRIELGLRGRQQGRAHEPAGDEAPGGAVLGRNAVDEIGRLDAAGARHVANHDRRIAGNIFADGLGDRARIGRQGARALAGPDIDADDLSGIEVIRPRGTRQCDRQAQAQRKQSPHVTLVAERGKAKRKQCFA